MSLLFEFAFKLLLAVSHLTGVSPTKELNKIPDVFIAYFYLYHIYIHLFIF